MSVLISGANQDLERPIDDLREDGAVAAASDSSQETEAGSLRETFVESDRVGATGCLIAMADQVVREIGAAESVGPRRPDD
jgi:hypothetical protein